MSWTPEKHIESKKVHADQLISQLRALGLTVDAPEYKRKALNNITITGKHKTFKLSHHNFYRFSGIATTQVSAGMKGKEKKYRLKTMTDPMYYTLLKGIILHCLKSDEELEKMKNNN